MKFLGHPVHLMLIHFPAALFPTELVCYLIFYQTGNALFANASFLMVCCGVFGGWLSIITGVIDLIMIQNNGNLQAKALIHGSVNSTVVLGYSVIAGILYKHYPGLPATTVTMLLIKVALNALMIAGNYLGGNLVLKYKIGVQPG